MAIPNQIDKGNLPVVEDQNLQRLMGACADRLNSDAAQAWGDLDRTDALTIAGGVTAGASGLTSTLLGALLPRDTPSDDHLAQKVGVASTAIIAALAAGAAMLAKLTQSPTVPLTARAAAESQYVAGLKATALGRHLDYASLRFIDCATSGSPPAVTVPKDLQAAAVVP
jgi:hypothetical protein